MMHPRDASPAQIGDRGFAAVPTLALFLAYAAIALATIMPQGLATELQHGNTSLGMLMSQVALREALGLGDAGSYIELAFNLVRTGAINSPGHVPLWSPGMIWLNAVVYLVIGPNGPAALAFAVIVAAAWGAMLTQLARLLYFHVGRWWICLLPLVMLALPVTRKFLLDVGIFYSEPLSIAIFFTGVFLLAEAGLVASWRKAIVAGVLLLAAAMLRQAFEMVLQASSALFAVILLLNWIIDRTRLASDRSSIIGRMGSAQDIMAIAIALAIFQSGSIAYRSYNLMAFGEFRWGFTDYYFAYAWTPDEDYTPVQRFILDAGGNTACRIEPDMCRELKAERIRTQTTPFVAYRSAMMTTMIRHPLSWQAHKLPHLAAFWAAQPSLGGPPVPGSLAVAIVMAFGLLIAIGSSIAMVLRGQGLALPVMTVGLVGATYLIAMVLHIEGRYLYPLQVGSIVLALAGLTSLWSGLAPTWSIDHWRRATDHANTMFVRSERWLGELRLRYHLLFWIALTCVITLPHGLSSTVSYCCGWMLPVTGTNAEIYAHFGDADGGSYARLGRELAMGMDAKPLWSPGVIWLYAAIYKLFGPQAPAALFVMIPGILAWSSFCFMFGLTLFRLSGNGFAWLAPATLFVVPTTLQFLLGVGLLFSETLSTALWGCGMLGCILAARSQSFLGAAVAGLALILAALVRNAFEMVTQFIFAITLAICLFLVLRGAVRWWRMSADRTRAALARATTAALRPMMALVVALAVFQAGAIGYRAFNLVKHGGFAWNFADYYFEQPWLTTGEFTSGAQFLLRGGVNIACDIKPATCARFKAIRDQYGRGVVPMAVYKRQLVKTIITHPVEWQVRKLPIIGEYWMSDFAWAGPHAGGTLRPILAALALLVGLALSLALLLNGIAPVASTLFLGVSTGFYLLINATHLEVRYLIPLQIYAPVILLIALACWQRRLGSGDLSEKPRSG